MSKKFDTKVMELNETHILSPIFSVMDNFYSVVKHIKTYISGRQPLERLR